jgi:hypothetical protein
MWILPHVGLLRNEPVDERARQVALEGYIFNRLLSSSDFQSMAGRRRKGLLARCQGFLDIALFDRISVDFELLKI